MIQEFNQGPTEVRGTKAKIWTTSYFARSYYQLLTVPVTESLVRYLTIGGARRPLFHKKGKTYINYFDLTTISIT